MFTAEVNVHSQSREDRNKVLIKTLEKVISRLITDNEFTQNSTVKSALGNATTYVELEVGSTTISKEMPNTMKYEKIF